MSPIPPLAVGTTTHPRRGANEGYPDAAFRPRPLGIGSLAAAHPQPQTPMPIPAPNIPAVPPIPVGHSGHIECMTETAKGGLPGHAILTACIGHPRTRRRAADQTGISIDTARTHLQRMFDKARANSPSALVQVLPGTGAPKV